ncbi:hypothetical protein BC943DRAFT_320042 [Umbelopsis sp. AD052]|nr:hypothetical protein BC943DRAFT_320042 [Umbelopsis sp. AD052]
MLHAVGYTGSMKQNVPLQPNIRTNSASRRSIAWSCQHCHRRFHTEKNLHQHRLLNRHF